MAKLNQSQRRRMRQAKAAAAALTGPKPVLTTGSGANLHRVAHPAARGHRAATRKQVEMVVNHYHFHQQVVAGSIPTKMYGGQDMSVPPPALPKSYRVVQSHPKISAPQPNNRSKPQHLSVLKANKSVVRVRSDKPILTLWGSSHLVLRKRGGLGLNVEEGLRSRFQRVINLSRGGAQLTDGKTNEIVRAIRSHPGPNQVYVFLFGATICARLTSRFWKLLEWFHASAGSWSRLKRPESGSCCVEPFLIQTRLSILN